jgi:hypothetical protein
MKSKKISKADFKEDVKSDKGLVNPIKNLLKQKPSNKKSK